MLLLLLWAVSVGAAATARIVVQLVVAYDQVKCANCCDILNDAVSDTNNKPGLQGYLFQAKSVALHRNFTRNVEELCQAVTNANASVVISVADAGSTLAAVTVGGYARSNSIPVLGFAPGYFDHTYKVRYLVPL